MIFKPSMIAGIQAGTKTVTRRSLDAPYEVGRDYAIQKGMAGPTVGRLLILERDIVRLGDVDDAEARLEGVVDRTAFVELWCRINGRFDADAEVLRFRFEEISRCAELCPACAGSGLEALQ